MRIGRRTTLALAAGVLAAAPAMAWADPRDAGGPRVLWTSTIGSPVTLPDGGCDGAAEGVRSEAMPQVGVDPGDPKVLQATWSAHGEQLQMVGTSRDGGRTWSADALTDAAGCAGGPDERSLSVNTLFDVGAGGSGYVGQSWLNSAEEPEFRYSIAVHRIGSGRPGGEPVAGDKASQNAAVVADPADPEHVAVAWAAMTQVPNPFAYTPLPNEIRFAESFDGGRTWSPHVLVQRAPAGEQLVNPRLVRATDGGYVLLVDRIRLTEFPGAKLRLTTAELTFSAQRSDDGRRWSAPVALGSGHLHEAKRPDEGSTPVLPAAKPDLAAGPSNEVAAVWHDVTRTTVRMARSADGGRTWSPAQDTVSLPGLPYQAAVAIDGRGATGLFWYDLREDRVGDQEWTVRPWVAVLGRDGTWRDTPLDEPFDLGAAQECSPGLVPTSESCTPGSHAGPLGVYQDLEGLERGFGAAYTVAGTLAQDGFTDVRYAQVAPGGRAG